jgi:hypothetical protein
MERFREWAAGLGDQLTRRDDARYYPNRSINWLQTAHDEGCLLERATDWLDEYKGLGGDAAANRMIDIVKAGLEPWEAVLLERGRPWTPYVTDAQRAVLHQVLADTHRLAASHMRSRIRAREQMDARRAGL